MGLRSFFKNMKKEQKEEAKFFLKNIQFAYTEDGKLCEPFIINLDKTKIKDLNTGKIVELEGQSEELTKSETYEVIVKALRELYDLKDVQLYDENSQIVKVPVDVKYSGMKELMLENSVLFPAGKSKVMKGIRKHIDSYFDIEFGTFESDENMIESGIKYAGEVTASELVPFTKQMSSILSQNFECRMENVEKKNREEQSLTF